MDGLNLKILGSPLDYFKFDSYGSLIPDRNNLRMEQVQKELSKQLAADTGLYKRMTDMYYRTDVEFTDNPYGNTPTMGVGMKRYGKRPLNVKFRDRLSHVSGVTPAIDRQLKNRQNKIVHDQKGYMALHASLEPSDKESSEYLQWLVEGDQVMTGGGFDGNSIGEVNKSALNFVNKSNEPLDYADSPYSKLIVEGALWLKDELQRNGLKLGSLKPDGAHTVRLEQESDGMIGYPLYSKAFAELTREQATRLLQYSGVDIRKNVDSYVLDERSGQRTKYRCIDAISDILDQLKVNAPSMPANITLLARIQKHAWKVENGEVVPSKPKTRSIYPPAAIPGIQEAMTFSPFLRSLQELKAPFMPSLQDKPTRVSMIKSMIESAMNKGYDYLAADWSKWDATVKGHILATIIYYAVRPFYSSEWQSWVDMAMYTLTYKYLMCDTALCSINAEDFKTAKSSGPWVEVKPFTVFGLIDGLISGAKFTHVGGSMYGEVVIHYAIPRLLGYEPIIGPQAGDDTLMGIPKSMIDISSAEATYGPIEKHAKALGLDMNASKQIWHNVKGEVVKVFLQDVYHASTETWGVGSIFRPLSAVFFSERDKGLTPSEQLMAEISRMNQGADSAFAKPVVKHWLSLEKALGSLFKELGTNAFAAIVESIGDDWSQISERIGVGSFTFGVDRKDLENGTLPILPVMVEVSSQMTFDKSAATYFKTLGIQAVGSTDTNDVSDLEYASDDLTSEEEVVLAD